jgi:hypothetical protein
MAAQIPILKLRRSQPEQGKSVTVEFIDNDGKSLGMLLLSFDYWIKFQKLIQRGQESNAREQYPVQLKIVVEGFVPGKSKVRPLEIHALYREPVEESTIATPEQQAEAQEEEYAEEELQKVLAETTPDPKAVEQQLIRTLKAGE